MSGTGAATMSLDQWKMFSTDRPMSQGGSNVLTQSDPDIGTDYMIYGAKMGDFAPGAPTSIVSFNIQQDAAFEWAGTTFGVELAGGTAPQSANVDVPIEIQITDSGSSRQLFFLPVQVSQMAGSGSQIYLLPTTKIFIPLATITITATTYDATNTWNGLRIYFHGRRLYQYGGATQFGGA